ncbi:MAG: 4-hydroxy-tetrahydrodipicolinate synthase [Clostridia bacterium]|jgi:4-hydroxy-tetrahydrodipicolinate synthase|nr:4-hydroxy-tetrahydrodipicolinate synthase [Clostridia bacterium]
MLTLKGFEASGIVVPIVTPFTQKQIINKSILCELVRRLIEAGIHGIVTPGSTGEFYALEDAEKIKLMESVVNEVDHKIPVWGGTGAVTTRKSIELTQRAEKIGVDAVMVISPFYILPNEDELFYHYKAISDNTNLPVIIYSNPNRTHVSFSEAIIERLAQIDNIVGIKDSSGQPALITEYIRNTSNSFSILTGHDPLILFSLMHGAKGAVSAIANIVPSLVVGLYENFRNGNFREAQKKQKQITELHNVLKIGTFPAGIKEALEIIGVRVGPARFPVKNLSIKSRACLQAIIKDL